jgi:hypothetical protein
MVPTQRSDHDRPGCPTTEPLHISGKVLRTIVVLRALQLGDLICTVPAPNLGNQGYRPPDRSGQDVLLKTKCPSEKPVELPTGTVSLQ